MIIVQITNVFFFFFCYSACVILCMEFKIESLEVYITRINSFLHVSDEYDTEIEKNYVVTIASQIFKNHSKFNCE